MKLLLKIILGLFLTLAVLLLALAAFTQTARFKAWLRDELLAQTQEKLAGELTLGRIEGNLVSNFQLVDLQLDYAGEMLARAPRVEVGFRLLPLLDGHIQIDKILIDSLALNLKQEPDSLWNAQKLARTETDTASASTMRFSLSNLEIRRGFIHFMPLDTASFLYRRRLEQIALDLQLEQERNRLVLDVAQLSCKVSNFPLALQNFKGRLRYDADSLRVENLALQIGASKLQGELAITDFARLTYRAHLSASPLLLEEAQAFFPQITPSGFLQIAAKVSGEARSARGTLALRHEAGKADLNFTITQDSVLAYELGAEIRGLDLAKLLPERAPSSRLNLNLELNGEGATLETIAASANISVDSSRIAQVPIAHLLAEVALGGGQIFGNALFLSPHGAAAVIGSVRDFQRAQAFTLNLDAQNFDAGALLQDSTLASNLSFELAGEGHGFDPQQMTFNGRLALAPASFKNIALDTLFSAFHWREETLWLDTLDARTNLARVQAEGRVSLQRENDLQFHVELGNLALVRAAMKADTLDARGTIRGRMQGLADSVRVAGAFHLTQIKYNRTKLDTLLGDFTFARRDSGGAVHAFGRRILAAVIPLDSLRATVAYNFAHADVAAEFWEGLQHRGEVRGRYVFGEVGRFHVQQAALEALDRHWETPPDSMWIDVGEFDFFYHHLKLRSGRTQVFAHGKIDVRGPQDFRFGVEELQLASVAERLGYREDLRGALTFEAQLRGALEQPQIAAHVLLRDGKFAEFAFEHLAGSFAFQNEQISWGFTLAQDPTRVLAGEGFLPVRMAAGDSGLVLRNDRPIRIQAATENLDLAFLQTFLPKLRRVKGSLSFDAKLENTWREPKPFGKFNVAEGEFSVPENGTAYRDVRLGLDISPGVFKLASKVRSEKDGSLSLNVVANYENGKILSAEGDLQAQNFLVARTRDVELLLDAEVRAGGDLQQLSYAGDATIKRARFFLEGLQRQTALELEAPFTTAPADSTRVAAAPVADPIAPLLQKIHGELKIIIPRNTWIRGPEVNLELAGELNFIQDGQAFSAFGPIRIVRGNYELFGKRFEVQEGEIIFQGDIENPPTLALTARYVYRLDKEKHEMLVK
ncbi:MAG: translocation/assembly module TamB domain-containing protein, partial [candidate division KSB1 bacterium]